MDELLQGYPIKIQFPVAWGEMDAFRHVNNINYFRYFENARLVYFQKLNINELMEQTGIGPILGETNCRFKIPLQYPDEVIVGAQINDIQADRFNMHYAIASQQHQKIAAEGNGLIVVYNYQERQKTTMPNVLRERIEAIENHR